MTSLVRRVGGALARLAGIARRGEREERLDDEMRFHVDMLAARNERAGMPPDQARRAALVAFGGRQRFAEDARDEYRSRAVEELAQDARFAWRTLRRSPAFTASAALTLALGIGATTVTFSVVDHVVLRPLAYAQTDRLVVVREISSAMRQLSPTIPANAAHFLEWEQRCTLCDGVAAIRGMGLTLTGDGDPERLGAARVSANLFPLLGVRPQLGRFFTSEEDNPGSDRVVVVSDAFWRRQFGADPSIVGRPITLSDATYDVIGVLPADFRFPRGHELGELVSLPRQTDVFKPLALTQRERTTHGEYDYAVVARLKPAVAVAQARAQLDAIVASYAHESAQDTTQRVALVPLQEQVIGAAARGLLLLLAAVAAVLLIVCVNLANLLLARNAGRMRESAIRVALGAGRGRLVRQALTESAVLALVGGAIGVVLSRWGLRLLLAVAPADLPRLDEVRLDARVLGVALLVSLLVGLAFGVLPALRFGRAAPGEALKTTGDRTSTEGSGGRRMRAIFIASQVGISTVLLVAAGLFLSSFVRVLRVDKGFAVEHVLTLDVLLPRDYATSTQRTQFFDEALHRLAALPGARSTALTSRLPLAGEAEINMLRVEHGATQPDRPAPSANVRFVSPSYFATLRIPLRRGRVFAETDRERDVIVLSEGAARALWPGEDPIGKRVMAVDNAKPAEVVGIVPDLRTSSLEGEGRVAAYLPYWHAGPVLASLLVRTTGDPAALASAARAELRRIAPRAPVPQVRTMEQLVSSTLARRRFQLVLLALFAATALATACVGIYGVIAHSLARRSGEIGIRMALGARPGDVHRLVLREGLTPVALGLAGGALVAIALGRVFSSLLFEVHAADPTTLAGVALVLGLVATVACYVPARRATAADLVATLRRE